MRILFCSFILISTSLFSKIDPTPPSTYTPTYCFFLPPKGWEIADPNALSQHVKIAFLKKGNKGFCPSINLAIEETQASLNEYLKAVKAIHERDRRNEWRSLGKVRTQAGLAQLTEIDSVTEFGPIRMLQLIFLKQGYAYVLTTAALKEEFSEHYKDFQSTFRSLTLTTDLAESIPQLERRETLKKEQFKLLSVWENISDTQENPLSFQENTTFQTSHWQPFQQLIIDHFQDMGPYWQALILRSTHESLIALNAKNTEEH